MHILRVANFVSPTSGGIKTALRHWGELYQARGHTASLVIPVGKGEEPGVTHESQGTVYRVPATRIVGTDYSLMFSRIRMSRLMEKISPDTLEVSDRSTTRWMGRWARRRGIGSIMISHENMTGIMVRRTPVPDAPAVWIADFINSRSADDYDAIVCPSNFAAEEFRRNGIPAKVVELGVDLEVFHPDDSYTHLTPGGNRRTDDEALQIIHCGRMAPEKNPQLSIETLRALVARGVPAHLTVLGQGPLREQLIEGARDLPVTFHSYIRGRAELATVMQRAGSPGGARLRGPDGVPGRGRAGGGREGRRHRRTVGPGEDLRRGAGAQPAPGRPSPRQGSGRDVQLGELSRRHAGHPRGSGASAQELTRRRHA